MGDSLHSTDEIVMDQRSMPNFNSSWVNYKGAWFTTLVVIIALKMLYSVMPFLSPDLSWTLTNLSFNAGQYIMFHWVTGIPFENHQGAYDGLTLWEQIDGGVQFTATRKFFVAVPILLFLLSVHYTHYDVFLFAINFSALLLVLIPKLPAMHLVRMFGDKDMQLTE
ncbi:uncharacterized protein BYT42DRAFT_564321 [Radiomyces spectabilis]|uniref:uncharacterized protein n=1 Tax=Radiomyces spectabilis TaxID=64574 RepID=UPI0022202852|nr:uncharacterized protein BYT42DRAFT_564321 [Radiomyces spectabilis]KAI8384997.1 hypothetical protein BYT42DRAFT_564321 [Radiomyces spectabilis]